MNRLEEHEQISSSESELENLIEHLKNHEYKCILQGTNPPDWVCNSGMLLLHMAIHHKSLELVEFLSDNSHNINSKNVSGDTALLIALKSNNFEAVKILLDVDADVRVTDALGQTPLKLLMKKPRKVISDIVPHFVKNLKRHKLELATLVELFVAANCPFEYVNLMNDAQVNREFLKRNVLGDLELSMNLAMERHDYENVELIMLYGNKSGRLAFYRNLSHFCMTDQLKSRKAFIERLIDWDVVNTEAPTHLNHIFWTASTESLQILLDCKIHLLVREKFGIDLRAAMFGNPRVDAIELLRNQNFNVNSRSLKQESALHFAVKNNMLKNVSFLLNSGANANIKDERGRTALFDCTFDHNGMDSVNLLLANGANVQVADNNGLTAFEFFKSKSLDMLKFIIAQLAINALEGVPIKQAILDQIFANETYRNMYDACFEELTFLNKWIIGAPVMMESTEEYAVSRYVSFFTVLTDKIEMFYRHIHIQDVIALLDQCNNQYSTLHWLYYSTLKIKLIKASNLYRFKCDFSDIISKKTGKFVDFNHLATRNITEYLTDRDIEQFVNSSILQSSKQFMDAACVNMSNDTSCEVIYNF